MQTSARQTISSFLDVTLDNRYVRWAGGLLLLVGIARAVLGLVSGDPGKALVLGLSAAGGILLAALYVEPLIHRERRRSRDGDRKASTESVQEGRTEDADPAPISSKHARDGVHSTALISIDSDSRREALKDFLVEGRRMQKAANPLAAMKGQAGLQPPPTGAQIDRWQGRVRAALPSAHKRRFRFAPLEHEANESPLYAMASIGAAFESKASKRLKASVDELQRIMDDLDCP